MVRARVAFYDHDRYFAPDIKEICDLIVQGHLNQLVVQSLLPSLAGEEVE